MSDLRDGDWQLGYSPTSVYPGAELTFGRLESGIYCRTEPDVAFADSDRADAALPGEDGIRMGRDYQRSMTITLELAVDGVDRPVDRHGDLLPWAGGRRIGQFLTLSSPGQPARPGPREPYRWASDGVDLLRQAWRADAVRGRAGGVAWLLHRTAGRTRQVYGRPRKFAVGDSRLTRQGYTPVVCDFVTIDDRFYSSVEKRAEMYDAYYTGPVWRPGRPGAGGFQSKKSARIEQLGRVDTYPYVRIHGPCRDPKVTVAGLWTVQVAMAIQKGDHVTIDARPWARTVMHDMGSSTRSVADKLTSASPRLAEMRIPPGYWTASLAYSRVSSGPVLGGPRVEIVWRDAFAWW